MKLQSKVLKFLKAQPDTWVIKVEVANERGCPDILCCHKGMFCGIEIKEGRDRLSSIQGEQLQRILDAGGKTIVVRSMDDIKNFKG